MTHLFGALALTLAACVSVARASGQGITSVTPPQPAPVAPDYFGLVIHSLVVPQKTHAGDRLSTWPSVPFGSWRLWDVRVLWPNLEPARDKWDFSRLDRYVALAQQHGVELLLPLAMTPTWASARPDEKAAYGTGYAAPPRDIDDWRIFVRTVAQRYKGRIHLYELWDEVNYAKFFSGTPEELVELARVAQQTLKAVDPANQLTSPSVVGDRGHVDWLDNYLARGGKEWADIVAYHFYVPKGAPEDMLPIIARVRQVMARNGLADRPLWNTETGWSIPNAAPTAAIGAVEPGWKPLDGELAAAYLVRAYILGAAAGLGRFDWYAWDNPEMGLVDAGDQSLKPAALAYGAAFRLLVGSTVQGCALQAGTWRCTLQTADPTPFVLAWRGGDDRAFVPLPTGWPAASLQPVAGGGPPVTVSGPFQIGPQPIVLRRLAERP